MIEWILKCPIIKPIKINQFKNIKKKITSFKIGVTNNTQNKPQRKTPTHTHQKSIHMKNQLKLRK